MEYFKSFIMFQIYWKNIAGWCTSPAWLCFIFLIKEISMRFEKYLRNINVHRKTRWIPQLIFRVNLTSCLFVIFLCVYMFLIKSSSRFYSGLIWPIVNSSNLFFFYGGRGEEWESGVFLFIFHSEFSSFWYLKINVN